VVAVSFSLCADGKSCGTNRQNFLAKGTTPDEVAKLFRGDSPRLILTMLSKQPCVNTFVQNPSTSCRQLPAFPVGN